MLLIYKYEVKNMLILCQIARILLSFCNYNAHKYNNL